MQTNRADSGARPGMMRTLTLTLSESGIPAIYQGLTASLLRQVSHVWKRDGFNANAIPLPAHIFHDSYWDVRIYKEQANQWCVRARFSARLLGGRDSGTRVFAKHSRYSGKKPTTTQLILAGAVAGGFGGIAGNPADIVLVRMTTDSLRPPEKQLGYRNALDGVMRIARDEGLSALMRGAVPNTVSSIKWPGQCTGRTKLSVAQIRAVLMTSSQMAT